MNDKVTPICLYGQDYPGSVVLQARGSQGIDIAVTIFNEDGS